MTQRTPRSPAKALLAFALLTAALLVPCSTAQAGNEGDVPVNAGLKEESFHKALKAEDAGARAMRAWESFNADHALGLAYSLMKLGRHAEALKLAEEFRDTKEDFARIVRDIRMRAAREAFNARDFRETDVQLRKILLQEPTNAEALELRAWARFERGELQEALEYFMKKFEQSPGPGPAAAVINILRKTDRKAAFDFARALASSPTEGLREPAASFYDQQGCKMLAAAALRKPGSCYYNADKPHADAHVTVRTKTGDPGLSRLTETTTRLTAGFPAGAGREVALSLSVTNLYSGTAENGPFAGSPYLGPQLRPLITSLSIYEPEVTLKAEGPTNFALAVGTTALSAPVPPMPTFRAQIKRGPFAVNLHQESVRESILSYSGLKDPYGGESWGRVIRSGTSAELSVSPLKDHVLYLSLGLDHYWGRNVQRNNAWRANTAFGRTIPGNRVDVFVGAFASALGFSDNTNFFTFGHGGYFSPRSFVSAGPVLRINTKYCKRLWADLQASVNYFAYKTDAPHYPLGGAGAPAGTYNGDNFEGIGYGLQFEWLRLMGGNWQAGGSLKLSRASDYTEWQAGIELRYFTEPRSTVTH